MVAQTVKNPSAMQETQVRSLGWKYPLEKGMATHSSILPWKNPWKEELGRLYSPWDCKEWDTTVQLTLPRVIMKRVTHQRLLIPDLRLL